jgi:TadE-like protein
LFRLGRRAQCERGQAVIEFLIILPVFLALVFGVVNLGKGYSYWDDMTHLAGEGGRYASVSWFPGCAPPPATGACGGQTLQTYVIGAADLKELANSSNPTEAAGCPGVPDPNAIGDVPCKLRVTFCYPVADGTGGVTNGQPGSALRIDIQSVYRLSLVKAVLSPVGGGNLGNINLKAHSTIRLEQPVDLARLGVASIAQCP